MTRVETFFAIEGTEKVNTEGQGIKELKDESGKETARRFAVL